MQAEHRVCEDQTSLRALGFRHLGEERQGLLTPQPCASGSRSLIARLRISRVFDAGNCRRSTRRIVVPAVFPMCRKMIVGTPSSRAAGCAALIGTKDTRGPEAAGPCRGVRTARAPERRGRDERRSAYQVLLVAGTGQIGATIMSRVLAQVPGFVAVGELGHLRDKGLIENRAQDAVSRSWSARSGRSSARWRSGAGRGSMRGTSPGSAAPCC